jgi:hypothetical protein
VDALEKAGIYQRVPIRRLFLKSPDDSLIKGSGRSPERDGMASFTFSEIMAPEDRKTTRSSLLRSHARALRLCGGFRLLLIRRRF